MLDSIIEYVQTIISMPNIEDLDVYHVIIGSAIIILSYFASLLAKKTNIPSVLVLIAMGICIKKLIELFFGYGDIPNQNLILELLGRLV